MGTSVPAVNEMTSFPGVGTHVGDSGVGRRGLSSKVIKNIKKQRPLSSLGPTLRTPFSMTAR